MTGSDGSRVGAGPGPGSKADAATTADREERASSGARPTAATERTCVVTGASRGIGRGIAEAFGREGWNVAVNYRSRGEAAARTAEAVETDGGEALVVQADVADRAAVERMSEAVHDRFGGVDVLVNNAGTTVDGKFENLTPEDWQRVVDVNLGGVFHCTQAFYHDVREAEEGRIVNISSVVGQRGNFGQANYAATKSALFGFTRTLALELAPYGSTANCVAPGFIQTDMLATVPDHVADRIRERIPLDRFGEVEDVTSAVRYLAGEESSYVTGQVLSVNGGMVFR